MRVRSPRRRRRDGLYRRARALERSLLPDDLPAVEGLELASAYRPVADGGQAGGDFYDAFVLPSGVWLVVGNVCGKGTEAAALTAMVRHSIRALAFRLRSPAALLRTVNDVMLSHELFGCFATAVVARIDLGVRGGGARVVTGEGAPGVPGEPSARRVPGALGEPGAPGEPGPRGALATIASAGHPAPLLLAPDGAARAVPVEGALLGVLPRPTLEDVHVEFAACASLILYTDGLADAGAPSHALSTAELCQALAPHGGAPPGVLTECLEQLALARGAPLLRDDIAVLAARVAG